MPEEFTLPTVEECRDFLALVNKGRDAVGLKLLARIDFDNAEPGSGENCLSARNLFLAGDEHAFVFFESVSGADPRLMDAIGSVEDMIPDAILRVTDAFDAREPGLRERLVEAGVVAP